MKPSTDVVEIALGLIKVPETYKRSINWKNEDGTVFIENMGRGQINPINVVKNGDNGYDLICGQRRLGAARKLGWKSIVCKIETWDEAQQGWYRQAENVARTHYTPGQKAKANQELLRQFDKCFGEEGPHSAQKRAVELSNEALAIPFEPKQTFLDPEPRIPVEQTQEEEKPVARKPGRPAKPSPSKHLAAATGVTERTARYDVMVARNIPEHELTILEEANVSRKDLIKIANLFNSEARSRATSLICFGGMKVKDAIAQTKEEMYPKPLAPPVMTDEEWLGHFCKGIRREIQNTLWFDRDALLYRDDREARGKHRESSQELVLKAVKRGWTPLSGLLRRILFLSAPDDWRLCNSCVGKNNDNPRCEECKGCGYFIQFQTPKTKK